MRTGLVGRVGAVLGGARGRRPLIAALFMTTLIATTAAHCEGPPPPPVGSAKLEVLNGPVVTAGDTLRLRATLDEETAPEQVTLYFTGPDKALFAWWYEYPAGECGALDETPIPQIDPQVDFSTDIDCLMPTWVENGTWSVRALFSNGFATSTTFEVAGGVDDPSGPTVQVTDFPTQPVIAGESFEVATRIADPNGVAVYEEAVYWTLGPGPIPKCTKISELPHGSVDIEVRWSCTTSTRSAGSYTATFNAFDLQWRAAANSPKRTVTIV